MFERRTHPRYITTTLLIHLDDSSAAVQDAAMAPLQRLAKLMRREQFAPLVQARCFLPPRQGVRRTRSTPLGPGVLVAPAATCGSHKGQLTAT